MITRTMLASKIEDINKLVYPLLATPKLDGIRCVFTNGKALSRTFKAIPNRYVRKTIETCLKEYTLDGELMLVNTPFNEISSAIMSFNGEPDFRYYVFDCIKDDIEKPYSNRVKDLWNALLPPEWCAKVIPKFISNIDKLLAYESEMLNLGYEGIMLRSPDSPYKEGRSTFREHYLLKLKRIKDSEAVIIDLEEQTHNENEKESDNFGNTKRSSKQENMVLANTLGKFVVRELGNTPWKDMTFRVGTGKGLTQNLRQHIWNNKSKYVGAVIKYNYQEHGTVDLPRTPVWVGFRDKIDM